MTTVSERDYWAIILDGDDHALYTWQSMLEPGFDPFIQRLDAIDRMVLRSSKFDNFTDAFEVGGFAAPMISDINGAIKAIQECSYVRLESVCEVRKDGSTMTYVSLQGTLSSTIELVGRLSFGSDASATPQPSIVQKWTALASADDIVRDIFEHLGNEENWYNLYKAFEGVRALAERTGKLTSRSWISDSSVRQFTQTANHIRHGRGHPAWRKPPKPMSLQEASRFVRSLVYGIMAELSP